MKIVDSTKVTQTSKMIETDKAYYVNSIHYDKNTMNPTVFKAFCDEGIPDSFAFNQTIIPYCEPKWFTAMRNGNIMVDKNNPNICYVSNYASIKDESTPRLKRAFQINVFINGRKMYKQIYANDEVYSWGVNFVKWIGQSDTYLYCSIVENETSGAYPDSVNYPISTKILKIKKTLDNLNINYTSKGNMLQKIKKSNGDCRILKETDNTIYLITEKYSEYEFGKIDKSNDTYTLINNFNIRDDLYYSDINTSGVRADIKKIDDNNFICYISGRRQTSVDSGIYEDLLQQVIINTNLETIDIKPITVNQSPIFKHKYAHYYNQINYLENEDKKYLITSTNVFYKSATKLSDEDTILHMYEINESNSDSSTGVLKHYLKASDLSGELIGILFNQKLKSFMLLTTATTYIMNLDFVSEKMILKNLEIASTGIGIDLIGNFWAIDALSQVHIFSKETISEVKINIPQEDFNYEGASIQTNISVATINYDGGYMRANIRLIIDGEAIFTDDGSTIKIIDTLNTGFIDIPITINNAGTVRIIPEVLF